VLDFRIHVIRYVAA